MAPDPADDGCATADLVTAIDQATRDGVDVLNLSVGGPAGFDTVERALLGAAEADVVVVAAAGNAGDRAFAAHASPGSPPSAAPPASPAAARSGWAPHGSADRRDGLDPRHRPGPRGARRRSSPPPARAGRRPGSARPAASTPPGSPAPSSSARGAASGGSTSPRRCSRPTASAWCSSTPAADRSPPTSTASRPSTSTGPAAPRLRRWLADHPRGRATLRPIGVERAPARRHALVRQRRPGRRRAEARRRGARRSACSAPCRRGSARPAGTSSPGRPRRPRTPAAPRPSSLARHDWPASVVRSALATTAAPGRRRGLGAAPGRRAGAPGPRGLAGGGVRRARRRLPRLARPARSPHDRLNTPSLLLGDQHVDGDPDDHERRPPGDVLLLVGPGLHPPRRCR